MDDDEDLSEVIALTLSHAGYNVRTALNGLDALNAMEAITPALVILDLAMPILNGLELSEELRTWGVTVPVLVISGAQADLGATAQQIGAAGFLRKPFEMYDLLIKVDELIGSHFMAKWRGPAGGIRQRAGFDCDLDESGDL